MVEDPTTATIVTIDVTETFKPLTDDDISKQKQDYIIYNNEHVR